MIDISKIHLLELLQYFSTYGKSHLRRAIKEQTLQIITFASAFQKILHQQYVSYNKKVNLQQQKN